MLFIESKTNLKSLN